MIKQIKLVVVSSLFVLTSSLPAMAGEKQLASVSVKIGYFNLGMVKANCPMAASSDILKAQAESQLRDELESSNKMIQKMKADKKDANEIQAAIQKAQSMLSAKQEALAQLVQAQASQVNMKIVQAVSQVAKEKDLDVIVDGQSIYAGGQKFLDSGVDVTKEIISKVNSNQL